VARALDVRLPHRLVVRGHVVDRGEVEEVVDLLVEAFHAETGLREVAGHRDDAVVCVQTLRE
jgi:hypothetical protein